MANGTQSNVHSNKMLTLEMVKEAKELLESLTPTESPLDLFLIQGQSGLNIMKNDVIPEGTAMVSKRLFDLIFRAANVRL